MNRIWDCGNLVYFKGDIKPKIATSNILHEKIIVEQASTKQSKIENKKLILHNGKKESKEHKLRIIKEFVKLKGGNCVSTEYRGSRLPFKFLCSCGRRFNQNLKYYLEKGNTYCPICNRKEMVLKLRHKKSTTF